MTWKNLLLLAGLFGVLAWFALQRATDKAKGVGITPVLVPLVDGFAAERVRSVSVDNRERAVQIKLETDGQGRWFLTDPVAYPAEEGVLVTLFRTLATAYGAPSGDVEIGEVDLDPPLAVLVIEQQEDDGPRRVRIDVGAVDLDQDRIFVRVHDHPASPDGEPLVLRTTRTIYNLLDRIPEDYRSRRTTPILAQDVVAVTRRGRAWDQERSELVDLSLIADQDGGRWKRRDGPVVTLEPNAVGLVAMGAAQLDVVRFTFDAPGDYSAWGLEDPAVEIELGTRDGDRVTLHLGTPEVVGPVAGPPGVWYCRRQGYDHVWEVDPDDVRLLLRPADELYDQLLVRAHRSDVRRVRIEGAGGVLVLEKEGDRESLLWRVRREREGGAGESFHADHGKVQDVLAAIEATQLEHPAGLVFEPLEPASSITVTTEDGMRWGGAFGTPYRDPTVGLLGRRFLRFGDELPAVIEEKVAALIELGLDDFRSNRIHRVRDFDVKSVTLTHGGRTFRYDHPNEKDWNLSESRFDAPTGFVELTQTLFALRAERWLEPEDRPAEPLDALDVVLTPRDGGEPLSFTLARDESGGVLWIDGERAAEVSRQQLADHAATYRGVGFFEGLLELFRE